METAVALIPILPFLGFIANGLGGRRFPKRLTATIACLGPIASFGCSVAALAHFLGEGDPRPIAATLYTWIRAEDLAISFRLVVDQLSVFMCLIVTGIGSLIHIYSAEYMGHEPRGSYARYFAYLNLFMTFMLLLVTASSLPLMFVGWEGVGLASFLLIGFWYENEDYASAGKKAFIVNRIGDFAFLVGIFVIFASMGVKSLEFSDINAAAGGKDVHVGVLATAAVCLFIGATGKSAQIPLYVWLPDAMAGPTPVSALIHAATMVTAGVYMVARLHGLFGAAPYALEIVAAIGIATALFAATMGLAEWDLKKVLAYSTISQLGYMFVGLGAGAFGAGLFHLFTHAFFKALLFLGAGAIIHALGGATDLRKMGGLRTKLPKTHLVFLVGALALSGIPPFAGFFSKDEILATAFGRAAHGSPGWLAVWLLGALTAAITAFYTFRAFALAFLGEPRGPADAHLHAHEPGRRMRWPLYLLALGAAGAGFLNVPELFAHGWERVDHFLGPVFGAREAPHASPLAAWASAIGITLLAVAAAVSATWIYSAGPEARPLDALLARPLARRLHEAVSRKYWVDEIYDAYPVRWVREGAVALWDSVDVALIDNAVHGVAGVAYAVAGQLRRVQAGVLNQYALYVAGGVVIVVSFVMGWL